MNNLKILLNNYFPLTVRLILGKALLFFLVWKFIFIFFLRESKIIDYPLTTHVGEYSIKFLNSFGFPSDFIINRELRKSIRNGKTSEYEVSQVYYNNKKVVYVADGCNALELMVGYIGFIFCLPSRFKRKARYIILGLITIQSLNIVRIAGLIYVNKFHQVHFDFVHLYLFKGVVYSATLGMWMLYLRKVQIKRETILTGAGMA